MTVELWSFSRTLGVDAAELRGMSVEARDGDIGKVVELVDRIGAACLIVDTGPWIFGKKVMLPAGVITAVDPEERCVFIDRAKDDVKNAPEHDPDATDDPAQRDALGAHYGTRPEAVAGITPEPGAAVPAAGTHEATAAPRSFGDLDDDPATTPVTPSSGAAGQVGLPPTPGVDADSDADTAHRVDEDESPAAIGAAWQRPEGSGAESIGSGTGPLDRPRTDEAPQAELAAQPAADVTDQPPASSRDAKRRFPRDEDSRAGRAGATSRSGSGDRAARKSSHPVPIAGYDSLTAAEVVARLPNLSQRQLADLERHEKRHESRRTVLGRIESLREKEPWRGYDDEKVEQIRKKLADADDDRARRVRDYERRHRDRKGVMEAARRAVASA